jgi:hypothetical protein
MGRMKWETNRKKNEGNRDQEGKQNEYTKNKKEGLKKGKE